MAIVWQDSIRGTTYQVRKAGNSIRLYTDGIFHSQWNPEKPVGGNIWELLFLPAFYSADPWRLKRVLVLGVGGGAVINLLNRFIRPVSVIGLDLDATHLRLARRFFKVTSTNTQLIQAEARQWVEDYDGPRFDLVIEDLFAGNDGEPVRAINADGDWLKALKRLLGREGILVMNHESARQLGDTAARAKRAALFEHAARMTRPHYENAIGIFSDGPLDRKRLLRHLSDFPELDRRRKSCKLDFVPRRL